MATTNERLEAIQKNLAALVGATQVKAMKPAAFFKYAIEQVSKASGEPTEKMVRRLKALYQAVEIAKDNYVDEDSESIKVPIFVEDQTSLKDQSNKLSTPDQAAALNPDGKTAFEQGFVSKLDALQKAIASLGKVDGEEPGDDEEEEDDEDEDAEKKNGAEKAAEDIEEGDDSVKGAKKGEEDAGGDGGAVEDENKKKPAADTKKKVAKVARDEWPDDMNARPVTKADTDWGKDD